MDWERVERGALTPNAQLWNGIWLPRDTKEDILVATEADRYDLVPVYAERQVTVSRGDA